MVKGGLFCLMVLAGGLGVPQARSDEAGDRHRSEQQLAAVVRWEVLWDDLPAGFRTPSDGRADLALGLDSNSLSYCSHKIGVCARYRTDANRNWERDASAKCDGGQSDEQALLFFVGGSLRQGNPETGSRARPTLGPGGLGGLPSRGSPVIWTATIRLGSRDETVQRYRLMHPQAIEGLKQWIRASAARDAGIGSVTIACFAPSDPMVYYYVDRALKGPVEMAVYWDRERQQWAVASSLERTQGPRRFDETRRLIESIPCATLKLE